MMNSGCIAAVSAIRRCRGGERSATSNFWLSLFELRTPPEVLADPARRAGEGRRVRALMPSTLVGDVLGARHGEIVSRC